MSVSHWLVIVSALISVAGSAAYIRDTLRGKTKPNRVSWSVWALAPLLGTVAAVAAGADLWATARVFLAGLLPLLVFLASFMNAKSYWKLTLFDVLAGVCAVVALALWAITQSPQLAILFLALGDGFACLPTLRKAWRFPETETGSAYIASFVSVVLIIPSIPEWNIENAAFQVYLLIANTLLVLAVYRKRLWAWLRHSL